MKAAAAVLVVALLGAGCGRGGARVSVGTTPAPSASTPTCPAPPAHRFVWPARVPADLPQPPGAQLEATETRGDAFVVRFSSPIGLRQGVLFLLREVPRAGYTVGKGDAEPIEADVPFGRADLSGFYKLRSLSSCTTDWIVAVSRGVPSPYPFVRTPTQGASSSATPFG